MQIEPVVESMNLLTPEEAAEILGKSRGYLYIANISGHKIPYVMFDGKYRLYEKSVVLELARDMQQFRLTRKGPKRTNCNPFLLFLENSKITVKEFVDFSGKAKTFENISCGLFPNLDALKSTIESLGADFAKLDSDYREWRKIHKPAKSYKFDTTSPLGKALFEKWGRHGAFRLSALTGFSVGCIVSVCNGKVIPLWSTKAKIVAALDSVGVDGKRAMVPFKKRKKPNTKRGFLSAVQVANMIGVSETALNRWRLKKTGPPYVRIGRKFLYKESDVKAFIDSKRVLQ